MLVVHISCVLERNLYHTVSEKSLKKKKNVMCYNQMIVAIVDVLTSFIFIFTNDNR
jgi:hypothetical protein